MVSIVPMADIFLTPASTACLTAAASPWSRNPRIEARLAGTFDDDDDDGDDDDGDVGG